MTDDTTYRTLEGEAEAFLVNIDAECVKAGRPVMSDRIRAILRDSFRQGAVMMMVQMLRANDAEKKAIVLDCVDYMGTLGPTLSSFGSELRAIIESSDT